MKPEMDRWHNRILWCLAFPPILLGTIVNETFFTTAKLKIRRSHLKKNRDKDMEKCEARKQALMEEVSDLAARENQGRLVIERLEDQISERRLEAMSKLQDEIALMKTKKEEELKEWFRAIEKEMALEIAAKKKMEMAKIEEEAGEERTTLASEVEVERKKRTTELEEELIKLKKNNEEEIRAAKEKALAGVMEWTKREENRLKERLEKEYEAQLSSLRGALEKKIQDEFGHIHELFASLANQKKAVAEKDIKEFLDKKLADIVSTIKT